MPFKFTNIALLAVLISCCTLWGQNVSLYKQYNGKYDFTFIGNTLNTVENNSIFGQPSPPCTILTSSTASLNLNPNDIVENAYLYWAGSGTGDLAIKLNGVDFTADRTFSITNSSGLPCFSAFKDITTFVQTTGNGNYTLSDLDLTNIIDDYCPNGGNFGGWALLIVYKNTNLPINQINVYDGMQSVPSSLSITLSNLNVIDSTGAKIGFIAWEGDKNIAVDETLTLNGNIISDPPLNPANNAFNGTNSITGSNTLFNMDLDIYSIQNNINVGDTSALIELTSGQDFVMINVVVTKLNSKLPDASMVINNFIQTCNSKTISIDYTVFNNNATNPLPANTPIAFYINNVLVGQSQTGLSIPINGSQTGQITITLADTISSNFTITAQVDDKGTGIGVVPEIDETNNSCSFAISMWIPPTVGSLESIVACNEGLTKGTFDFSSYENLVLQNINDQFDGFYNSLSDAQNGVNPILNPTHYTATTTPKEIFIRVKNGYCPSFTSFLLTTKNCPPTVYNYISANGDNINEAFHVEGLRDVFINFKIEIYNRWGRLIWTGNNQSEDWNGYSNTGNRLDDMNSPKGTYYYLIYLNDDSYPEPLQGFLYITR